VEQIIDFKRLPLNSESFFRLTETFKKEISGTELINHLLYQVDRRKSQACNTKCINTSTRLKYKFQSLHNFNFSEKEQDDICKLRNFKKKMNHQVP